MGRGGEMIEGGTNFHYGCVHGDCFESNELRRSVVLGGTLKCNIDGTYLGRKRRGAIGKVRASV